MATKARCDLSNPGTTYNPFWHTQITAGRAGEGLRDEWREQLIELQDEIGFDYMRFHGLFHEEMMIYREEKDGTPIYNWQYFDALFDFLLEVGIRPLMELSFMPTDLASTECTCFWWKGRSSPPKDYAKWEELIRRLVVHSINRYGLHEVRQWYFEVWNEPNLKGIFWDGEMEDYFELYASTAKAIKAVDPALRVGGPATSNFTPEGEAPWLKEFLAHCAENGLPLDFISTHPYPNTWPVDAEGNQRTAYRDKDSTPKDMKWIQDCVKASAYPDAEIHLTEWNSSPSPRDLVHDTAFMAPFLIYNNLKSIGFADSLGYWAFTDIFEENRQGDTIFHGGFGLINPQGLKKAGYYGYWFLAQLGTEMLALEDDFCITRTADEIQVLAWHYVHYNAQFSDGDRSKLQPLDRYGIFEDVGPFEAAIELANAEAESYRIIEYRLDRENGSVYDAWLRNGAPAEPTPEELEVLRKQMGPVGRLEARAPEGGKITLEAELPPHGVVMWKLRPQRL